MKKRIKGAILGYVIGILLCVICTKAHFDNSMVGLVGIVLGSLFIVNSFDKFFDN